MTQNEAGQLTRPGTLEHRLEVTRNRPAGFDYSRLFLATMVVVWHTVVTGYGLEVQNVMWRSDGRFAIAMILPPFFAVSGFLVTSSLERTKTLFAFLSLRIIRIVPALAGETLVTALILGPFLTSCSLGEYFSSPVLWRYLINLTTIIQYRLPGFVLQNPSPEIVNGQLWSLPYEVECYGVLAALGLIGLLRSRYLYLGVIMCLQLAFLGRALFGTAVIDMGVPARVLILSFLAGSTLFRFRDKIPHSKMLALLSFASCMIALAVPRGAYFIAFPAAYLVTYLGLLNPRRLWIVRSGDYSYGIFLYGFAVQQAVVAIVPGGHNWYINLAASLPIVFLLAYVSWHGLEKHVLKLRKFVHDYEDRWISVHDRAIPNWMKRSSDGLGLAAPLRRQ